MVRVSLLYLAATSLQAELTRFWSTARQATQRAFLTRAPGS